ncbi:MAG: DnaA N-terminal domain-containing protein, partial [Acidobacteriota bacterium]
MDTTEKSNCWTQILDSLQNQVDKSSFETWLSPTSYIGLEGDDLYIKVPNSYFKDWLSFHYTSLINKVSEQLFGKIYQLKYIIADSSSAFIRKNPYERRTKQGALLNPNLNPNYTFENFIV